MYCTEKAEQMELVFRMEALLSQGYIVLEWVWVPQNNGNIFSVIVYTALAP